MKFRIIGIAATFAMLLTVVLINAVDWDNPNNRVHQHLVFRQPDEGCDCDKSELCTHLPLIIIDTGGEEIPGEPIEESVIPETGEYTEFTTTADGEPTLECTVKVMDTQESNHHPSDTPDLETAARIRIRGNTSRNFDKVGYLLTITEDDYIKNKDVGMMGMDAHHEWALHGPIMDKTLIRNYMWYNISGEIMEYAPNVRFCELIINGEYLGLYVMTETINNSETSRLRMSEPQDGVSRVSYVVRLDRGSENTVKNINSFIMYTYRTRNAIDIVYPGPSNLTEERIQYIHDDLSSFEKTLYSYDRDTGSYAWWNYADMKSFAEYCILNEFICNYEVGARSTYMYRDVQGKFHMCMWDLNTCCGNMRQDVGTTHFEIQYLPWFVMMFKDDEFVEYIIDRYCDLRETYLNEDYLMQYIDDTIEYLGSAIERNFEVWGYTFESFRTLNPDSRNPDNYEQAVEQLKDFIRERGAWMGENIDILLQYSHDSRNKKFNH